MANDGLEARVGNDAKPQATTPTLCMLSGLPIYMTGLNTPAPKPEPKKMLLPDCCMLSGELQYPEVNPSTQTTYLAVPVSRTKPIIALGYTPEPTKYTPAKIGDGSLLIGL